MFTTANLLNAAQWAGILTLVFGAITVLGFVLKWGIRFRLVGVTSFMGVLTGGFFALGLGLFSHTTIPGAVRYTVIYDNGSTQIAIALSTPVTESQVEATLRQAAADLFSYGRLGQTSSQMTIRARTMIHPESGVSKPLYLGQVQRSPSNNQDNPLDIKIYSRNFAQLPKPTV